MEKSFLPLSEIELGFLSRLPRSLVTMLTELSRLLSHCSDHKKITQYKPTKCTFSELIFQFLIVGVFYMFLTRGSIFRKTVIYTGMV